MAGRQTYSIAASDTGILRRFKSSWSLWLSSVSRRSFNSAMDCFLVLPLSLVRISYGADILLSRAQRGAAQRSGG